jgi:molybdenum cofactor cytidylyltransferase
MGALGDKLLLPLRGSPLIAHVAEVARASRLARVTVVVGPEAEGVRALPGDGRFRVVQNARAAEGRSTSIRAGLAATEAVAPEAPGVLYLLGDQPLMSAALIDAVIAAAEAQEAGGAAVDRAAPLVVPTLPGMNGSAAKGNPVLFRRPLFDALRSLTGDRGALSLIESLWSEAAFVPIEDPTTQFRVETPEDYRRLLEWAERASPRRGR